LEVKVFFDRSELNRIIPLYGRMVAAGEWRDYAIDALEDCALFSIYRRTSESPLYQIEKRPANVHKQGVYAGQLILRRGQEIEPVLRVLKPKRMRVVENSPQTKTPRLAPRRLKAFLAAI
jgi:hypothetical protein